jgi:hypothetical protein
VEVLGVDAADTRPDERSVPGDLGLGVARLDTARPFADAGIKRIAPSPKEEVGEGPGA